MQCTHAQHIHDCELTDDKEFVSSPPLLWLEDEEYCPNYTLAIFNSSFKYSSLSPCWWPEILLAIKLQ